MIEIFTSGSAAPDTDRIIRAVLSEPWDRRKYFIAPETVKAQVERMLIDELKKIPDTSYSASVTTDDDRTIDVTGSFVNGEVLSFMRLSRRLLQASGRSDEGDHGRIIMRNAVYRVLMDHGDEFRMFRKLAGKYEYIDKLIDLLGDFSRYNISESDVTKALAASEEGDDVSYRDKLHDLKLMMGYLALLGEQYSLDLLNNDISEANAMLQKLLKDRALLDSRRYRQVGKLIDARFIFIGFGKVRAFTPEETGFIRSLHLLGSRVTIFALYSDGDDRLCSVGRKVISQIREEIPEAVVKDASSYIGEEPSGGGVPAQAAREYSLGMLKPSFSAASDNIISASMGPLEDRIAYIANEIIDLTRNKGYRYRDIRIVCADHEVRERMYPVMKLFGLDVFTDRRILSDNTPVFRYAVALCDLSEDGFRLESVLRVLRSGFSSVPLEIIDAFENYCIAQNITSGMRMFDPDYYVSRGRYYMRIQTPDGIIPAAEYLWTEVVERVLIPLRQEVHEIFSGETLREKSHALAVHISGLSDIVRMLASEMKDRGDLDDAAAFVNGYKELMDLLVILSEEMNDVKISRKAFRSLIITDMRNRSQGNIPLNIDSIDITDPLNAYVTPCRVLFLIGAVSENYPYSRVNEGIMTGEELSKMADTVDIRLPDRAESRHDTEFISSALMFSAVSDRIYIVHEYLKPESYPEKFFAALAGRTDINNFTMPSAGRICAEKRHDFRSCDIDPEVMRRILGDNARMSVSALDKYNACHFSHVVNRILGIDERTDNREVRKNQMGTIVHYMLEYAVNKASSGRTASGLVSYADGLGNDPDALATLAAEAFDEYCANAGDANSMTEEFRINPGRKARRMFSVIFPPIIRESGSSGYVPEDYEVDLARMRDPLTIDTPSGTKFLFAGSIDRVDREEGTGNRRIIDYKTGEKEISEDLIRAGLQSQLFGYSLALGMNLDEGIVKDAGYFNLKLRATKQNNLKPDMAGFDPGKMQELEETVRRNIEKGCRDITEGRSSALVHRLAVKDACMFCIFRGRCGNYYKSPECREDGKEDGGGTGTDATEDNHC